MFEISTQTPKEQSYEEQESTPFWLTSSGQQMIAEGGIAISLLSLLAIIIRCATLFVKAIKS